MITSVTPNPEPAAEPERSPSTAAAVPPSVDDAASLVVTIAPKPPVPPAAVAAPVATASPSPVASPIPTPTPSPVASPSPSPTPSPSSTPTPSPTPLPTAAETAAYPLVTNPSWLTGLGRVSVLPGVVVASDGGTGATKILTTYGELVVILPPELAARLPPETAVRLLLSQSTEPLQVTVVLVPADRPLPPIDFSQGNRGPAQLLTNWPRAALGSEIGLAVAATPSALAATGRAAAAGVTSGEANTAVAIDGLVAVEKTGTPISTGFLASLIGQAGASSPPPELEPRSTVRPQTVSPLAISTTTDGFSGPVPILSKVGSGSGSGTATATATATASDATRPPSNPSLATTNEPKPYPRC